MRHCHTTLPAEALTWDNMCRCHCSYLGQQLLLLADRDAKISELDIKHGERPPHVRKCLHFRHSRFTKAAPSEEGNCRRDLYIQPENVFLLHLQSA